MRNLSRVSFEEDITSDDEIDELFSHLEQFEPPVDFIERVMKSVSRLPHFPLIEPAQAEDDKTLVVHHQLIPPVQ